jgi:hypothetical protein
MVLFVSESYCIYSNNHLKILTSILAYRITIHQYAYNVDHQNHLHLFQINLHMILDLVTDVGFHFTQFVSFISEPPKLGIYRCRFDIKFRVNGYPMTLGRSRSSV